MVELGLRVTAPLYVLWCEELQDAFGELARREGVRGAAQRLDIAERIFFDYRTGMSRAGVNDGRRLPRKFLSLRILERLADVLDDPRLEDHEALTQRGWCDRGEWSYFSHTEAA